VNDAATPEAAPSAPSAAWAMSSGVGTTPSVKIAPLTPPRTSVVHEGVDVEHPAEPQPGGAFPDAAAGVGWA
jgi:hypothetical protein